MFVEILTIGDELCRGEIVDTNSSGLAAKLWDLQITARWLTSCRDDAHDMVTALSAAVKRADLVICSGGLGPTEDDLTVDVVSALCGVAPEIDPAARAVLEARFAGKRPITPTSLRQVRVPAGARVYFNPQGLAPGFEVSLSGTPIICLPGVPREVWGIYDHGVAARLRELRAARGEVAAIARRTYRVFGRGESQISEACQGILDNVPNASIHYQIKYPETLVKLVVTRPGEVEARQTLGELERSLRGRLGAFLYSADDEALPAMVCRKLRTAGLRVATAESCTGGLVAELLTQPAGASVYFVGAAICYTNAEKIRQLGVAEAMLAQEGAVSAACVQAMARGALAAFCCDLAVAISGIAGPDGGTADKPVGTVHLALARRTADGEIVEVCECLNLPFPRDLVRLYAAWAALRLIDQQLPAAPWRQLGDSSAL